MADWSSLSKDLLEQINARFETCFEIAHFRSVCSFWRSAIPPPSYSRYFGINTLLPILNESHRFEGDKRCRLEKIPICLLRFQTPFGADYMLVGMSQSSSSTQKLISPLRGYGLTTKYKIVLNTYTSQIIPLGHHYKIKFYATSDIANRRMSFSNRVAFLQDGKDFVVVARVFRDLLMYRSRDQKWTKIEGHISYQDMVSYKGMIYIVDRTSPGQVFVIGPSLEVSEILPLPKGRQYSEKMLVVSGDELLLVHQITPGRYGQEYMHTWFRVFRLEEEGQRKWVRINDLGDRVVFLGNDLNLCFPTTELPGTIGNCIVFIGPSNAGHRVLVFDLGTRKTSTEYRCYMGAFGENRQSFMPCGIVTEPNEVYELSSDSARDQMLGYPPLHKNLLRYPPLHKN